MGDNLKKRCDHPRRQWAKCKCPWYVEWQHKGEYIRLSLHKHADRPADYFMSKSEAEGLRDTIKTEVRAGTFGVVAVPEPGGLTFGDVADQYVTRHAYAVGRRPAASAEMARQVKMLRACEVPGPNGTMVRLEAKPVGQVTKADVEAIREARRAVLAVSQVALAEVGRLAALPPVDGAPVPIPKDLSLAARLARQAPKAGEVGINRLLTRLQHLFGWAIGEGLADETPFKRHGALVIKLNRKAETHRTRRLDGDEEARLIAAAGSHLQALIIGALESGCRRGELLSLQWGQVDLDAGTIFLPAAKTKTAEDRTVPITARLRAVLAMRRTDPEGRDLPPSAYVFGNEVGEPQDSIKTAWRLTCRRAGIENLHFHDLRRECGSRLIETPGISLVDVRDWLGHATVDQTNTYLSTTVQKLQAARVKVDRARQTAERKDRRKNHATVTHERKRPAPAEATGRIC